MEASIFNIQRYSLHDGGGIRTLVFFKGCPFTCPWCCNPESLKVKPEPIFKESLCIKCSMVNGQCTRTIKECPTKAKEMVGTYESIESVMDILVRDKVFYETSNGGISLSGGEILLQQDFGLQLLKECKKEKIHTAIESTMGIKIDDIKSWVRYCDVFLIDLKIMDVEQSKKILNIDINLVKKNILELKKLHATIIIRVPLIPTYTATIDNISSIISFMSESGLNQVHLLPYHRLAESKYQQLQLHYPLKSLDLLDDETCIQIKNKFKDANIDVSIHGH